MTAVLAEIDRARAARGAAPLARPEALQRAAEQRARDIAALPHHRRMNRQPRVDAFLAGRGIKNYAYARERLLMLGGYDDAPAEVVKLWKDYEEGWSAAMSPAVAQVGAGWAEAPDGWSIFLAILVEPVTPREAPEIDALERQAFEGVNRERAARGLPALAWNERLAAIARAHSRDMARRDYFDHVSPDGLHPRDRVKGAGLDYREIAENIASNRNVDRPARTAVEGWMDSPGHRANILNPRVAETGMGVAADEDGSLYFTQLFYLAP